MLVPRKKWNASNRNVKPGDIVVVSDHNQMRGKWTLGRIVQVFPGKDSYVRNVEVKTQKGLLSRPITKIAVLLPVEGYD